MLKELLQQALATLEAREWFSRHAAENPYCPDCATDAEDWEDQREHHPGCAYVKLVTDIKSALEQLGVTEQTVTVDYSDGPEDVARKFTEALGCLGVKAEDVSPAGVVYMQIRLTREQP